MPRLLSGLLGLAGLVGLGTSQQPGSVWPEEHPSLSLQSCTKAYGCVPEAAQLTLDAQRRWVHDARKDQYSNCGTPASWNITLCPDAASCARNCAVDGLRLQDYTDKYGVRSDSAGGVTIKYVANAHNFGSRLFVLDDKEEYTLFKLKNRELSFDIDVSSLPCGLNAALYFVEMQAGGGQGVGANAAGAKYGLGYCDARCPKGISFINGEANMDGTYGACCTEMDVFEANSAAASMTAHPCSSTGLARCEGLDCGDGSKGEYYQGLCDKDGCEFNSFRMGDQSFFGADLAVDTTKPITVVTQFITDDGTDAGNLVEIRRHYVQDGNVIPNSQASVGGIQGNSINEGVCNAQKQAFVATRDKGNMAGDYNQFAAKGGLAQMGAAMDRGMVLVLSLWDDQQTHMKWLDSKLPSGMPNGAPGVLRGSCPEEWGAPEALRVANPDASVRFWNLKYGELDSTQGPPPLMTATDAVNLPEGFLAIGRKSASKSRELEVSRVRTGSREVLPASDEPSSGPSRRTRLARDRHWKPTSSLLCFGALLCAAGTAYSINRHLGTAWVPVDEGSAQAAEGMGDPVLPEDAEGRRGLAMIFRWLAWRDARCMQAQYDTDVTDSDTENEQFDVHTGTVGPGLAADSRARS